MGIIPQNFSSQGFAVSEELGNKQTDSLTDWCFDREIGFSYKFKDILHECQYAALRPPWIVHNTFSLVKVKHK